MDPYKGKHKYLQHYFDKHFKKDLSRYLPDLQPSNIDDLRQDLSVHFYTELAHKQNYWRANNLQAYFSEMLHNYVINWALKRTRDKKRMTTNQDIRHKIRQSGSIDLEHPIYRNLNKDYLGTVILFYHARYTAEEIAKFRRTTEKSIYRKLDRATEIMKDNCNFNKQS